MVILHSAPFLRMQNCGWVIRRQVFSLQLRYVGRECEQQPGAQQAIDRNYSSGIS